MQVYDIRACPLDCGPQMQGKDRRQRCKGTGPERCAPGDRYPVFKRGCRAFQWGRLMTEDRNVVSLTYLFRGQVPDTGFYAASDRVGVFADVKNAHSMAVVTRDTMVKQASRVLRLVRR
ncbi:hypothetical protein PSDVSF_27190 [Pseudodesulfovibrio sediminis]|uniref:Uncharacterized protein n=1 Tax=Pseudodesulfovibrio sediminis TaxID=2810563 RepID=A0ABM7P8X2_9BACT|nr:hypothetical protein PSDVSF_27190 [Pseudodesulfovibrio sediminis]